MKHQSVLQTDSIDLYKKSCTKVFDEEYVSDIEYTKITNLPVLTNDTDNVIEFNDGLSNEIKNDKPRSFWNLLKFK